MRAIDADAFVRKIRKQYCEDCVRRKGIKNGKMQYLYEIGGVPCRACEIEDMLNEVEDAPPIHPEPHWIPVTKEEMFKAGYEGREIRFKVDGRLFAIRELAQ